MRKTIFIFLAATGIFAALTLGIYIGRNTSGFVMTLSPSPNSASSSSPQGTGSQRGKVNINSATVQQLTVLPGIGEVKAERIVEVREELGRYTSVDELLNVEGIGNALLEDIKPYITIGE